MASAARSPSIWLFVFCLTISSAVAGGTFAFFSAALASASESKIGLGARQPLGCDSLSLALGLL